jgi:hypothetical protein
MGGLYEAGGGQCATTGSAALNIRAVAITAHERPLFGDGPSTKALVEAVDSTTGINHFLLSGVEGVTLLAHIYRKIFATR